MKGSITPVRVWMAGVVRRRTTGTFYDAHVREAENLLVSPEPLGKPSQTRASSGFT